MTSRVLQRLSRFLVLIGAVSLAAATSAEATRPVRRTTRPASARGFNLFAGAVNVTMNVNRVQCNVNNIGESCVDGTNSPTLGGGFWPKGSPNQYIFNSGLQIAAIIPGAKTQFAWAGDTVGAFFFDPRGDQTMGEGRTNVFNALNLDDLAAWPTAAGINDTSLFHPALIGRQTVSQQDTWVRMWDGNTSLTNGRQHPMGILVEQRGLAWNFPSGNQDIIYFLYRFINITSTDAARYAGLSAAGYSGTDIAEIVTIAQEFQQRSETAFNVTIPDSGFTWTNIFASFAQDPDVGQAGQNYSNANLVFNLAMAYKSDFREPQWQFPSDINGAPFASAPGFEAVKYLKSPINPATGQEFGIAMSGNTTNGQPFPDAVGVQRLWRNLSGNLLPTDGTCSVPNPQVRRFCAWVQTPVDTRFFESSGPFTLAPGESATIVVAYVHAAPVASSPASTAANGSLPAFSLAPFVAGNMIPGFAISGSRLLGSGLNRDTVRNVDRAAGWLGHADLDFDGVIEQCSSPAPQPCSPEVQTLPRSLYNKSLVAQAVFDNKFLLPFAPEVPQFFLVPGDNQVTVAWQKSSTELVGDPFYAIASLVTSPLYDVNFKQNDVEGYRIWRGRTQSEMEVIASFDYVGTTINDFTGQFFSIDYGSQCAPELGLNGDATVSQTAPPPGYTRASCPVRFQTSPAPTTGSAHVVINLAGDVVQIPPGGRVEKAGVGSVNTARGDVLITSADTAVTGGGSGLPALVDNGVPFSFSDHGVLNGFRYFYAVTAFDVNSLKSGPSSLESPLVTKSITPRVPSGQETGGVLSPASLMGTDGVVLDQTTMPTLAPATGIFSGPMPATNGLDVGFVAFVPSLLDTGTVTVTIDSIVPGATATGDAGVTERQTVYYLRGQSSTSPGTVSFTVSFQVDLSSVEHEGSAPFAATPLNASQATRFGGDTTFSAYGNVTARNPGAWRLTNRGRGEANADPANSAFNGPRWWTGSANETTANPNGGNCSPSVGTCGTGTTLPNLALSVGSLGAGTVIWQLSSYNTVPSTPGRAFETMTAAVTRAADFRWHWGANGAVDSVVDVTHHVRVPFKTNIRASWGVMNDSSFIATTRPGADGSKAKLTFADVYCVDPAVTLIAQCGVGTATEVDNAQLMNHARLSPIVATTSSFAGTAAAPTTGNGFIIYLNGHFFVVQTATLPAAGTVWNARFYAGSITGNATAGNFAFQSATRPPNVPGLRAVFTWSGTSFDPATTTDASLASVHTVPDPYYVTNSLEVTANTKVLRFVNLPSQAIIRVYSASGILVTILTHNDPQAGGEQAWNLRNRNNQFVASGVYFYHVEAPDGRTKVGRFTVVNYAQ